MKYFILHPDKNFLAGPVLGNWKDLINPKWIGKDNFYQIPQRQIWPIVSTEDTVFPALITPPFLLVTEMVMSVIQMYGDNVLYRDVVLVDSKRKKVQRYFLVVLDELSVASLEISAGRNGLKKVTLIREGRPLKDRNIFSMILEGNKKVIINLDFAESILRRKAVGISLEEITLIERPGRE